MIYNNWLKIWANHYTPTVSWVSVKFPEAVKTERLYLQFQSTTCNQWSISQKKAFFAKLSELQYACSLNTTSVNQIFSGFSEHFHSLGFMDEVFSLQTPSLGQFPGHPEFFLWGPARSFSIICSEDLQDHSTFVHFLLHSFAWLIDIEQWQFGCQIIMVIEDSFTISLYKKCMRL
jgi:hypothetical protein